MIREKRVIDVSLFLSVFAGAMKNRLVLIDAIGSLLFFTLGLLLALLYQRLKRPRWLLAWAPAFYVILALVGAIVPDSTLALSRHYYDDTRFALMASLGEGAGLLIKLICNRIKKKI